MTVTQCYLPPSSLQDCLPSTLLLLPLDHRQVEMPSTRGGDCPLGGDVQIPDIVPPSHPSLPSPPSPLLLLIIRAANPLNCQKAKQKQKKIVRILKKDEGGQYRKVCE